MILRMSQLLFVKMHNFSHSILFVHDTISLFHVPAFEPHPPSAAGNSSATCGQTARFSPFFPPGFCRRNGGFHAVAAAYAAGHAARTAAVLQLSTPPDRDLAAPGRLFFVYIAQNRRENFVNSFLLHSFLQFANWELHLNKSSCIINNYNTCRAMRTVVLVSRTSRHDTAGSAVRYEKENGK